MYSLITGLKVNLIDINIEKHYVRHNNFLKLIKVLRYFFYLKIHNTLALDVQDKKKNL